MSRNGLRNGFRLLALVALSTGAAVAPGASRADTTDPVAVGAVRTLPVISVSLAVGSTEKEAKRVVYAPPPGWYIRSHRVECGKKHGLSSYTVSTVPADWQWASEERSSEATRAKAAAAVTTHEVMFGGGQAASETDKALTGQSRASSSHHILVVDAVAKGAGFLRGGGEIELTVTAEMVYLGKN